MSEHLVLIPGLLCTGDLFDHQIRNLSGGMTASVADTLAGATLGEMAEHLISSAPPRFCLAGLSMGGYVAFEVLARAPERVEKLVLIDTSARADLPEQSQARRDLVARARTDGIAAAVDALVPRLLAPAHQGDPELKRRLHQMGADVGVEGFARQQEAIIARPDRREWLAGVSLPTLVIVGEEDVLTPPKVAAEMAERLPDARLEIVAGSGHVSTMERPDELTRLLQDFCGPGR